MTETSSQPGNITRSYDLVSKDTIGVSHCLLTVEHRLGVSALTGADEEGNFRRMFVFAEDAGAEVGVPARKDIPQKEIA